MSQSEDIKELVTALSKAQGKMRPAVFNKVNPHFKNRYADFTSCMDAAREPLCENGLSIMQYCETINEKLHLVTLLAHTSGQWIKSYFPLNPINMTSQAIGSAMTYGKRYSLSSMLGIVSDEEEDDDAETAEGRGKLSKTNQKKNEIQEKNYPKISLQQATEITEILSECSPDYQDSIHSFLHKRYKNGGIENLESNLYEKVLTAALKKREEYFSKQRKDFQKQSLNDSYQEDCVNE